MDADFNLSPGRGAIKVERWHRFCSCVAASFYLPHAFRSALVVPAAAFRGFPCAEELPIYETCLLIGGPRAHDQLVLERRAEFFLAQMKRHGVRDLGIGWAGDVVERPPDYLTFAWALSWRDPEDLRWWLHCDPETTLGPLDEFYDSPTACALRGRGDT